jgi:hypothetical protein
MPTPRTIGSPPQHGAVMTEQWRGALAVQRRGGFARPRTTYGNTFCMDGVDRNAVVAASSLWLLAGVPARTVQAPHRVATSRCHIV